MSSFRVDIRKIEKVLLHPNADKLSLCTVEGLSCQFVMQKGLYNPGDIVVYFPIDSLLPSNLIQRLNLEGKLHGPNKNRVKTIKLRGQLSQGIFCHINDLKDLLPDVKLLDNVTEILGVKEYEHKYFRCKNANFYELPNGVSVYDIESCDRNLDTLQLLMRDEVVITEKLEGTNISIVFDVQNQKNYICTRKHSVVELKDVENDYWKVARDLDLLNKSKLIGERYFAKDKVILRGEFVGPHIQKNIYCLSKHTIFIFDIQIDRRYLNWFELCKVVKDFSIQIVPVLYTGILYDWPPLQKESIDKCSNGISKLFRTRREGIVIKMVVERNTSLLNSRLILKQRSPEYLSKSNL